MVIEYGRKPYIRIDQKGKKVSYQESMRLTSDEIMRTRDARLQQHSEFKKPYMTSSYQAMEKLRSLRVFNFNYGNFNLDFDFNVVSYPKFEGDPGEIWRWNPLLGYLEEIIDAGAIFNPCGKIPDDCFSSNSVIRNICITKWTRECGRYLPYCLVACTKIDCETREITCRAFIHPLGCWPGDIQLPQGVTQLEPLSTVVDQSIFGVTFKLDENINYFKICICGNLCCDEVNFTDDCGEEGGFGCNPNSSCKITGSDTILKNDTGQFELDCGNEFFIWEVEGTGASIDQNGLVTTGANACGAIKVTIGCGLGGQIDDIVDTFDIRVTDAGQWSDAVTCTETSTPCSCCAFCSCTIIECILEVGIYKYEQNDCWTKVTGFGPFSCAQECCGGSLTDCSSVCTTSDPFTSVGGGANCGVVNLKTYTWECV